MKSILKILLKRFVRHKKIRNKSDLYERKERYLGSLSGRRRVRALKKWYKKQPWYDVRVKLLLHIKRLAVKKLPLYLSFVRWVYIDLLRGKKRRVFGIYQFVALPGEGKTMSMVAHMERYIKECVEKGQKYVIATNFKYQKNDYFIEHWTDMVRISHECYKNKIPCLVAIDEVHITFDSSDWKNFPAEILAMLSFNRKYGLQFLCSSQIYERIPKKIRDIANWTVICKNVGHFDRLFRCYYFPKSDYESQFEGKRKRAKLVKEFIADDKFYSLYDTLEQVEMMVDKSKKEEGLRQQAFDILFGSREEPVLSEE